MQRHFLEIACFNLESALIAQEAGADRVELCSDIQLGGISPEINMLKKTRMELSIPVFVMIRPRGGDFVYTAPEFESMKNSIGGFKKMDVNGFVFGILDAFGNVDKERNMELIRLAHPFPCTFHRAFDTIEDSFKALDEIIECGFKTLLTSGGTDTAINGIDKLSALITYAGERIIIMPGGGIRSSNIRKIMEGTNACFFHSAAITDNSEIADTKEIRSIKKIMN